MTCPAAHRRIINLSVCFTLAAISPALALCPPTGGTFTDNFEGAAMGWTVDTAINDNMGASPNWQILPNDPLAHSASHSYFTSANSVAPVNAGLLSIKDDRLVSPVKKISSVSQLSFWHRFYTEATYDGGVLEFTSDGGTTWLDITTLGAGTFLAGAYNGAIDPDVPNSYESPIRGRAAWTTAAVLVGAAPPPTAMTQVTVRLAPLADLMVQFRWRLGLDNSAATPQEANGWWIDDVTITNLAAAVCNQPPVAVADAYGTQRNATLNISAPGVLTNDTDADGNPLTAVKVAEPTHGSVTLNANGSFTYTPTAGYVGADTFTYNANDGTANSTTPGTVTITIVNTAPVASNDGTYTTAEDTALNVSAPGVLGNDTDVNSDGLTASVVANPTHGSLTLNANGSFTYTPALNYNGSDSFTYQADDGVALSNTATATINVTAVNDAPVAVNNSYATDEDTPLNVSAPGVLGNDSDVDSGVLTATRISGPSHGSLTLNTNGSLSYTPASNYNGPDSFTYNASDGSAASNTATVNLTINSINDSPTAVDDEGGVNAGDAAVINVLANDSFAPDTGETLTISSVTQGAKGSVAITGGGTTVTYTAHGNASGGDSFSYTISDGNGGTATANVAMTITNLGPPALDFYTVTPCRVYDSRSGAPIGANSPNVIPVAGLCGIPATAKAVSLNVTAVSAGGGSGSLKLYPADLGEPVGPVVHFAAGDTRANNQVLALGATFGDLTSKATVVLHVALDVNGYFAQTP